MSLADEYKGWKVYWMAALDKELSSIQVDTVMAPTLDYAFKRARTLWPWADAWEFEGYQDPNDYECSLSTDKRIIEKIVREEIKQ